MTGLHDTAVKTGGILCWWPAVGFGMAMLKASCSRKRAIRFGVQ
jgi:hypothetical protein